MEILKFPNLKLRERSKQIDLKDTKEQSQIIKLVQEMQCTML